MEIEKEDIVSYFQDLQNKTCKGLEELDGSAKFTEDGWQREGGGGGISRVIQNGNMFEKGGVNFSEVFGDAPEFLKSQASSHKSQEFFATGVSLVIHPKSPMVPIIHMNVRYLELSPSPVGEGEGVKQWFGGGIDLTPIYVDEADAIYFHQTLKAICDRFHPSFYLEFKKWADDYFFIKHRNETRGVGGIFFDRLAPNIPLTPFKGGILSEGEGVDWGNIFEFVQAVGNIFLPVYTHLIRKNKDKLFGEKEKQWQLLRRGRYAEFNLAYDRGTKFGLETGGRTESVLMSLPPEAKWIYNFIPEKNSAEGKTLFLLKKGMEWAP